MLLGSRDYRELAVDREIRNSDTTCKEKCGNNLFLNLFQFNTYQTKKVIKDMRK